MWIYVVPQEYMNELEKNFKMAKDASPDQDQIGRELVHNFPNENGAKKYLQLVYHPEHTHAVIGISV